MYVYNKNNLNQEPTNESAIDDYLELFINFKLKVREAEALGLHKDSSFIKELEGYQKQLAAPYLTETRILDSLAMVTYERLKTEVNASHILIRVAKEASPEDTLQAFERIEQLSEMIDRNGKDFEQLAFEYSEDPSAKQNRGNLGYFTAMQMVYPFEEAVYRLPVDSVSKPIRTDFGYHLIKVNDKRPSQGRIQVSHILVRTQPDINQEDSVLAAKRAQEIYTKAINGGDWDLLCRQFSEDVGTKMKGGKLPWFKTGDISNIPTFEKAAFSIQQPGEISKPVKTAYGWHIIRLDARQGLEPFEQLEQKIRSNLSSNSRARLNQNELVKRLKEENRFKESQQVVDNALEFGNETLNKGAWKAQEHWNHLDQVLFTIEKSEYLVRDFYHYIEKNQPLKSETEVLAMMRSAYDQYVSDCLISYEENHLGEKHYDYKMLMKEYRDGILLFQLMESKVWNQAIQDTTGLKNFFNEHQDRYQWGTRASATIYNVDSETSINEVRKFLERGYLTYNKYDFYGTTETLNKAQVKILDDIAQSLLQGKDRFLTLEYHPESEQANQIKGMILDHLDTYKIDQKRISTKSSSNREGFIVYVASSSVEDLVENMNKKNPLTIQVEKGTYQQGENQLVDQITWTDGIYELESDGRKILIQINEVLPAGNQRLEEIRGQVISDYQTELETRWIKELRNKYPVVIYEKEVKKVHEQYN